MQAVAVRVPINVVVVVGKVKIDVKTFAKQRSVIIEWWRDKIHSMAAVLSAAAMSRMVVNLLRKERMLYIGSFGSSNLRLK